MPLRKRSRSQSTLYEELDEYNCKHGESSRKGDNNYRPAVKKPKTLLSSSSNRVLTPSSLSYRTLKQEEKWWTKGPRPRRNGTKWNILKHNGPLFTQPYKRLPKNAHFRYNRKRVCLSQGAEEVAGFYAKIIEHDHAKKEKFNQNFFKDWRASMTTKERTLITDLKKCDFSDINKYYKQKTEERKSMSKEEKFRIKERNEEIVQKYGIAVIDGYKQRIDNFRVEPPGLFMGRGNHPKMGMLKRRINPEDVIINCSHRPKPPPGRQWKEVRHDNTVTWLACWTDKIQGQLKYVWLNQASRLKGEKDRMKYEIARQLAKRIDRIRKNYNADLKSQETIIQQRAVAMYFIDKLALRAGNEKDEDKSDTVGCCSLRCEHVKLKGGRKNLVSLDFLGKDSIRYYKKVSVDNLVYKILKTLMENKKKCHPLFDKLNTTVLNKHLNDLMSGLTAKVFRTYNASRTLQQQLEKRTPAKGTLPEKMLAYNRAIRAVAILCNHQRAVPKTYEKSMQNLGNKITRKKDEIKNVKRDLKKFKKGTKCVVM